MSRPNILFLFTDQLRADVLGCTGGWVETPNIDALAALGTLFTRCYTNSPVCIPSRVSLATGCYPHNTGIWQNCHHVMPPWTPTWMQAIRAAGYRTSVFGKTHLHPHKGDLRDREHLLRAYGLDDVDEIGGPRASRHLMSHMTARWQRLGLLDAYRADFDERFGNRPWVARPSALPLEEYADVYVGSRAREYLEGYDRPEPWFCWASFGGPHEPWDTPEPYASRYAPADMPPPVMPAEGIDVADALRDGLLHRRMRRSESHPPFAEGEVASLRANYAGGVTLIDQQIGTLLETVRRRGEWDRTVVLFASDHGEMNGDYGLIYKENFLDGAVRVPLLARVPGLPGGRRYGGPVELMDVGPTLAELAGATLSYRQFGLSLAGPMRGEGASHRPDALSELSGELMLFDGRWKAALNTDGQVYLLFDQAEDPDERVNLAGRSGVEEIETRLRLRILERLAASHLNDPQPLAAATDRQPG